MRKTLGVLGLGALGLLGYQLMMGQVSLVDAAQRATAVMFALMLLQWLTRLAIAGAIRQIERDAQRPQSSSTAGREAIDLRRADSA